MKSTSRRPLGPRLICLCAHRKRRCSRRNSQHMTSRLLIRSPRRRKSGVRRLLSASRRARADVTYVTHWPLPMSQKSAGNCRIARRPADRPLQGRRHNDCGAAWHRQTDRARCCAVSSFRNLGKGKAIACGSNEFYELRFDHPALYLSPICAIFLSSLNGLLDFVLMARELDPLKLSSPRIFLLRMLVFVALVGVIVAVLRNQIEIAFMANPALNGLIILVLLI